MTSMEDWPLPLEELTQVQEGVEVQLDGSNVQVYCIESFFNDKYIWRMPTSRRLFEKLKVDWKLSEELEQPDWPTFLYVWNNLLEIPEWWSAKDARAEELIYLRTPEAKGDYIYWVAWDEEQELLYVCYSFQW
ncbi:MAG: hypothetical protein AAGA92_00430 [Planctomycetota bacterium]